MKVIGFTGMAGSGKSLAVNVAREMKISVIRMGDIVWDEVRKRGLELTDENVGNIATEERKKHGYGVWAERTVERIKRERAKVVAIDGVRGLAEVKVFRDAFGENFILIAVQSSQETRLRRLMRRKRKDEVCNEKEFIERDRRELEWGLAESIADADYVIENEGTVSEFKRKVKRLILSLIDKQRDFIA